MRKTLIILLIVLLSGLGTSFTASLVTTNGSSPRLFYDRETNFSGYYNGFPGGFEEPEYVGSLSFRDHSVVNPDLYINISGDSSKLEGRRINLFYSSRSGNITVPILQHPVLINEMSGSYKLVPVDLSAFRAVFPGRPYAGFAERTVTYNRTVNNTTTTVTETRPPSNLTKLEGSVMNGNYTLTPSILSVRDRTKLTVTEVLDPNETSLYERSVPDKDLVVTVMRNGAILDEKSLAFGKTKTFNFTFSGGEKVFVNGILSLKTKSVSGCGIINDNDFYYMLNESQFNKGSGNDSSCLEISNVNNTIVDFANQTIDGNGNESMQEGNCAIQLNNANNITVKNPRVQQFARGICLSDSHNSVITGTSAKANNLGIFMNDSTATIKGIELKNNRSEITAVKNSKTTMRDVDFATANVTGFGEDLKLDNVMNPPKDPEDLQNISQWVNITATDSSGYFNSLGFHYGSLSNLTVNPELIYKIDQSNSTASGWEFQKLTAIKRPVDKVIITSETIDEFSIFTVYGENITGDVGEGTAPGTGTQGPGQTQGGGTTPQPQPQPEPEPEPTAINLNLSLEDEYVKIQQGGVKDINFSVSNIGDVNARDIHVGANVDPGWTSGRQDFSAIPQGETVSGGILISPYQSEVIGNYSIPVYARSSTNSTLDMETLTVEVIPRQLIRDLQIVEGPTFLTLEGGESQSVGLLVKNIGDYKLENVTASVRNAPDCVNSVSGSHSFEIDERKNVEYTIETNGAEGSCTGVFVLSEGEKVLGFTPVRIKITEASLVERLTSNVLPIITLIWTIFTVYWIRRRLNG